MTRKPHVHHWRLPMSDGDTVEGTCKCGATKTFITAFDDDRARKRGARAKGWNEMTGRKSGADAAAERQARMEQGERERYAVADSDSVRKIN